MLRKAGIIIFALMMLSASIVLLSGSGMGEDAAAEITSVSYSINATIANNYAITTISQTLSNTGTADGETTISLNIPPGAFLSSFELELDGKTYVSVVVAKEAATEQYEGAKEEGKTATVVESSASTTTNSFTYKINIKAGQEVTYHLVYEEYIPRSKGVYEYSIPLSQNSYPSTGDFSIYVGLESVAGFNDILVPDFSDAAVENILVKKGSVNYLPESRSFSNDFVVEYSIVEYPPEGHLMNYQIGDQGYFMHVFCPGMDDVGGEALGKDIVFIIDRSGSMSGSKMTQTKDAFGSIINDLRSTDRFNIVRFDDVTETHETTLVDATDANVQAGADYINDTSPSGSTDINAAMLKGLEMFEAESSNVPIICFLTDGNPTSGTTDLATIRQNVLDNNAEDAAVFCLAFGDDCDLDFLKAMSLENDATATKIETGTDASDQIIGYYDTFSTPLVTDLTFGYGGDTWDIFPQEVASLFQGSEVVVVGRYDITLTSVQANVTGETSDGTTDFGQEFTLEKKTDNDFIPRYWASQKINELMDQMLIDGETQSLKENITSIALEYQFVTPYTSMILVVEDEPEGSGSETESSEWEEDEEKGGDDTGGDDDYTMPGTSSNNCSDEGDDSTLGKRYISPDSSDDGLQDDWENDDFDGDGFTDLEEYQHGEDPTDPNDYPSSPPPPKKKEHDVLLDKEPSIIFIGVSMLVGLIIAVSAIFFLYLNMRGKNRNRSQMNNILKRGRK